MGRQMNSYDLSLKFKLEHRNITRVIKEDMESLKFTINDIVKSSYTTNQNKEHTCYDLSDSYLSYLITSRKSFRATPERVSTASLILKSINVNHRVVIGDSTRQELKFGIMLDEFFGKNLEIISQYHIGGYFIDFFIPSMNIAIEFDEAHHNSTTRKELDKERVINIDRLVEASEEDENARVTWVRVCEGFEINGISKLMGAILHKGHENKINYLGFKEIK